MAVVHSENNVLLGMCEKRGFVTTPLGENMQVTLKLN